MASSQSEYTTISVKRPVAKKLEAAKPYPSMSYNDLLGEMVNQFDPNTE